MSKQAMRVLHIIPGYEIGGIESLIMSLYRNMDKSIIQFDLFVETQEWLPDFEEITQSGGKVYQINPLNKKKPLNYINEIKHFFKEHAEKYTIVHSHTVTRAAPILYYAKKSGIPCRISHAHTDSFDGNRFIPFWKLLLRVNNRLSTHYLAASQQAGSYYFDKDKKEFIVLKNTIDTEIFSYSPIKRKSLRKSLNLEGCFVIGHTGRFTYQKNHWKIVDVFYKVHKRLPKSHLLLVGDGPNMDEIREKASKLGILDAIIFTGARSNISDLLQAMDLFLLPSFFEAFCISLLEAQSVGLPCIASDIIPPDVQLTNLITTLSFDASDEKWADAIISSQNHQRSSQDQVIVAQGYDTKNNTEWLIDYYLSCSESK